MLLACIAVAISNCPWLLLLSLLEHHISIHDFPLSLLTVYLCGANTDRRKLQVLRSYITKLTELQPKNLLHWLTCSNLVARCEGSSKFNCSVYHVTVLFTMYLLFVNSFLKSKLFIIHFTRFINGMFSCKIKLWLLLQSEPCHVDPPNVHVYYHYRICMYNDLMGIIPIGHCAHLNITEALWHKFYACR